MIIIGIDPGNSGGIAWLTTESELPHAGPAAALKDLTEAETADQFRWLRGESDQVFAYLEQVHAFPKQGVSGVFTFGRSYGFLRGCLFSTGIPFDDVTPQRWQKAMGCMSKGDKNVTKARAQQLFPNIKITHATADSLLIAEYGRRLRSGELST